MSGKKSGDGTSSSRQRGVRVLGFAFLALFILIAGAALVAYLGFEGTPGHWTQQQARIQAMTEQERKAISANLSNRVTTGWSDSDNNVLFNDGDDVFGQKRTIEIPYEDLNVWLAEEGTDLLAGVGIKLPGWVKAAMVDSPGDGLLRISCDVERGEIQQVVAMSFDIEVQPDGIVESRLTSATAGRLPLPTQTAIDLIARRGDAGGIMLGLTQGTPVGPIELPIDASDNGRDGRLVGLEVRKDALLITRETVRRKRPKE